MTLQKLALGWLLVVAGCATPLSRRSASPFPTVEQVIAAKTDLWGEASLRQVDGPTYDFFAKLLPPLRYVDAWFRDYPIVLSAPSSAVKARFVSNGGTINALARQPNYINEAGVPVRVYVGPHRKLFGENSGSPASPHYERGYLPIITVTDQVDCLRFSQQVFAATDPALAAHGVVYVRITLEEGDAGKVELQIEGAEPLKNTKGVIHDKAGRVYLCTDPRWTYKPGMGSLIATLKKGESLIVAIPTDATSKPIPADAAAFEAARQQAVATWQGLIDRSMQVTVPEPIVNDAWRSLVCGSFALLKGDVICYSAGNQYAHIYEAEGGDAAQALGLWGHRADEKRMIVPLLDFTRKGLEFHQAGLKLGILSNYYWLTRDADFIKAMEPRWRKEVDRIVNGREKESGLLPREQYAGDIDTLVYSLNSNANSWRGLRDIAAVLDDMGRHEDAAKISAVAADFRKMILAALDKSIRRDVSPHFVPVALLGEETPYDRITAARPGSYYDLIIPYVLGSGVFRYDSEPATAIIDYLRQHGGLCMGMIRTGAEESFWVNPQNIDDLYGIRYDLALYERDDVDHTLVGFYGKLAQGMTRDTFIDGEGTSLKPLDAFGRQMYLPPNSAANAHFLYQLRYSLVQDWDLDDDGKPETLRLLFATPSAWLADSCEIKVLHAPTAFGEVSVVAKSQLKHGRVTVDVELPPNVPAKTLLRLRLPGGTRVRSATAESTVLAIQPDGSIDLSALRGKVRVDATVGAK